MHACQDSPCHSRGSAEERGTRFGRMTLTALTALALPSSSSLADFSFSNFVTINGLAFRGDATATNGLLRLMPTGYRPQIRSGAVWYTEVKQRASTGFQTEFTFRIGSGTGGDGIAFLLQNHAPSPIGGGAAGMAYDGLLLCLAVEFDTFRNIDIDDPNSNHIGVHSGGGNPASYHEAGRIGGLTVPSFDINDGAIHVVRITYTPGTLRVFLDGNVLPSLEVPITLTNINGQSILDSQGRCWVGFGSGTGGEDDNHDILSWSFVGGNPAGPPGSFTLVTPAPNASGVSTSPVFVWSAAIDADTYRLRLDDAPDFSSPIVDVANLTSTNFQAT